jgi:predicted transcriptional regulator
MQVLIELDELTYRRLEMVAPAKSRARSAFIRAAIQKSLWELEEEQTRKAYLDAPDDEATISDPAVWEPLAYGGFDPPKARAPARKRAAKRVRKRAPRQ